jgi:hypothetical protein
MKPKIKELSLIVIYIVIVLVIIGFITYSRMLFYLYVENEFLIGISPILELGVFIVMAMGIGKVTRLFFSKN